MYVSVFNIYLFIHISILWKGACVEVRRQLLNQQKAQSQGTANLNKPLSIAHGLCRSEVGGGV